MTRIQTPKERAKYQNILEITIYNRIIENLYLDIFEWVGMPDTVNLRFLEKTLFYKGFAIFFDSKKYGYVALEGSASRDIDIYQEPTGYVATTPKESFDVSIDDCVVIRDSPNMYPASIYCDRIATRLADATRTIEVTAKTMKRNWIIASSEENSMTHKILIDQIEGNELVSIVDKNAFDGRPPFAENTNTGQKLFYLWFHKDKLSREIYTFLGINNNEAQKRERLVSDEVSANDDLIALNTARMLNQRKMACEEINTKFGLNVSVKIKNEELLNDNDGADTDDTGATGPGDKSNTEKPPA